MNERDILKLVAKGESETLELKASVSDFKEVLETACAMANTRGGHIVIGVEESVNPIDPSERFRLQGIPTLRHILSNSERVGEQLVPPVNTDCETIDVDSGRVVLLISVSKRDGNELVSLKDGHTWIREGAANKSGHIFKPKTAAESKRSERDQVVAAILGTENSVIESSDISNRTGLAHETVAGHMERLAKRDMLSSIGQTLDGGAHAVVSSGNRIDLEDLIDRRSSSTEAGDKNSSDQRSSETDGAELEDAQPASDPPKKVVAGNADIVLEGVSMSATGQVKDADEDPDDSLDSPEQVSTEKPVQVDPKNVESQTVASQLYLNDSASVEVERAKRGGSVSVSRTTGQVCLRADDYGQVIADLLAETPDDESMSFAVFGHWGRGKTYLMDKVIEKLSGAKDLEYRTVKFSAWKYRTTPEAWAYLFEQFLFSATKSGFFIPWRAGFKRIGATPLLIALGSLCIALLTMSQRINLLTVVFQVLGFGTILYLGFLAFRFGATGFRLSNLYFMSGHADKLGMQAAIGDDLRALLQAWIPRYSDRSAWQQCVWWGQYIVYVLLCLCITVQLWPVRQMNGDLALPFGLGTVTRVVDPFAALVPYSLWLVAWFLGAVLALWPHRPKGKTRALLVVDDLDRCEPKQMLEIIESTLLILNDPEIEKRMQVAMLIDDEAFKHALIARYPQLLDLRESVAGEEENSNSEAADSEMTSRERRVTRLVRENQEKFFLMQLRLPPLSNSEVEDVLTSLSQDLLGSSKATDPSTKPPAETDDDVSVELEDAVQDDQQEESDTVDSAAFDDREGRQITKSILEPSERRALITAMQVQLGFQRNDHIGPRTVACLLHRYQLAREILRRMDVEPPPLELANAIMDAYWLDDENEELDSGKIQQIARQVS